MLPAQPTFWGIFDPLVETKSTESATSHEVYGVESSGHGEETATRSVFATTEEDDHGVGNDDVEQRTHHKRARSQSPHSEHKFSTKEEEIDEDPSDRQFLASVRGLLSYNHRRI